MFLQDVKSPDQFNVTRGRNRVEIYVREKVQLQGLIAVFSVSTGIGHTCE